MDVTPETIRRDLSYLERQGLVRRVHGGAVPVGRVFIEPSVDTRNEVLVDVKKRIAQAALAEIPRQGAVIVDAGSTTGRILDMIPEDYELTIITNSIEHAMRLSQRDSFTTMLVGGRLRGRTLACVDQWAVNALSGIVADLVIMGTNGIDPVHGLTTPDMAEANVKRAMMKSASGHVKQDKPQDKPRRTGHAFGMGDEGPSRIRG